MTLYRLRHALALGMVNVAVGGGIVLGVGAYLAITVPVQTAELLGALALDAYRARWWRA